MKTNFETGHATNVLNLSKFNDLVASFGATYNPKLAAISASALITLQTDVDAKLQAVSLAEKAWKLASHDREAAFSDLLVLPPRIMGLLKTTNAKQKTLDDFSFFVSKLRGSKRTPKEPVPSPTDATLPPTAETPPKRSTSQQSYGQRLDHFRNMVDLLAGLSDYDANETELKLASLQSMFNNLKDLNEKAEKASLDLKKVRAERNTLFYGPETGLLQIMKKAKGYITAIYGRSSQFNAMATAIKFVRVVPKKKTK